ncbi:hypothetical protein GBA52_020182 [Prunus armeniaca]|nr:hypothetical protein GBA52_020182 [Prunus armeniaca]
MPLKTLPVTDFNVAEAKEPQDAKQEAQFTDPDVERQISAIRVIRDVETEHLLTNLRLLRSYFNKEQQRTPLLQYFKENFQNLSNVRNGENGQMEVQWIDKDGNVSMNDGMDLHETLLRRLSIAYSGCSAAIPSLGGFEFSSKADKASLLGADNLQISDFVSSQRLSIGMTPKTRRLPKPGEMLLSVHGSPLGDYKEDNMEAIHDEAKFYISECMDMLAGAMDTTATAIEWTLSELIKHPRVMKKVQKELENVVGMEREVEESDLGKLEYLDMVVKETMRLHPVAPLLLPHAAIEDCNVNGFHIPQKSRVMINIFAIGRDPSIWTDAEKFIPERFDGSNIDFRGRDFQFIPFGSGRRGCPGMQLGITMVQLVVAQLVHCFDWELPNNMLPSELDMTEEFGLTVPRAKHLLAVPTYRLQQQ